VRILTNNGGLSFTPGIPIVVGELPWDLDAGDLDGDGDLDLVVVNADDGNISILRNNGLAQFTPDVQRLPVGEYPLSVVIGHFNNDLSPDIAVANAISGNVSIWMNEGGGMFGSNRVGVLAGANPASLAAADLDRDGDQDLVVTNLESQDISVLRNDGFGSFTKLPDNLKAGEGIASVVAVDIDHDTDPDLIVTNGYDLDTKTLQFSLLRNLSKPGQIAFSPPVGYGAGIFANWAVSFAVTAAQLNDDNGDGRVDQDDDLDVAIANGYAGGVSVVLNQVHAGAYHVTLTGLDPVDRLDFGFRQPGIAVTPTSGLVTNEAGDTAIVSVALRTRPDADVTLSFASSKLWAKGTVSPHDSDVHQ